MTEHGSIHASLEEIALRRAAWMQERHWHRSSPTTRLPLAPPYCLIDDGSSGNDGMPYLQHLLARVAKAEERDQVIKLATLVKVHLNNLQSIARAWWALWQNAISHADDLQMLRRGAAAWMSRGLVVRWRAWVEMASERSRQQQLQRKGDAHLHLRDGALCLTRWSVGSLLVKKTDKMRRRAWLHLQGAQLSRGWQLWLASSVAQAKLLPFQRYVAAKLRLRYLAMWRKAATSAHARYGAWSKAAIVMQRLMHRALSRGWSGWAERYHARRYSLEMGQRSVTSMQKLSVAQAWRSWDVWARSSADQGRLLHRCVSILLYYYLALGIRTWRMAVRCLIRKVTVGSRDRFEPTARRGTVSMALHRVRVATNSWVAMSEARQRVQQALRSSARTFSGYRMRKAWISWLSLVYDRQVALLQTDRSTLAFVHRGLVYGWSRWNLSWHHLAREHQNQRRAHRHWRCQLLLRGWLLIAAPRHLDLSSMSPSSGHRLRLGWTRWTRAASTDASRRRACRHLTHRARERSRQRSISSISSAVRLWQLAAWSQMRHALGEERRARQTAQQVLTLTEGADCPPIAALCRSLPLLASCWQVLALAESYRATAERAVRLLTERLRRVESANTDQADTLTVAMHECQHWLYKAREGWLKTSHDLEGLHQESSGVEGRLDDRHRESQAELRLISQTPTESEGSLSNQRQSEGSLSNQRQSSPPLLRSEDSLSNQPTTGLLSESEDSPLSEGRMEGRPLPHTPETPSMGGARARCSSQ